MSKTVFGPGGGAVPSSRGDEKMGSEHAVLYLYDGREWTFRDWRGWRQIMKRSMTKKRRQRDKIVIKLEDD